jgi:hypothetical protein
MSVTLSSMRDEAKLALGSRSDITDAMVDSWLNMSQLALATRLRIFEIEAAVTFDLIASPVTDIYGVPSDLWAPMILVNLSNNREEVSLRPIKTLLAKSATPAGRVREYGLRGKTTIFRPAPSTVDTLEWTYKKRVPTMTSVVNLTLPDEFAAAVIFDAIVRGMHLNGEEDRAQIYRAHRDDALAAIGDQRGEEFGQREEGVQIVHNEVRLA